MPQTKRTFDEVDAILAAISARQLHGVLFEPDPGNIQVDLDKSIKLGHLSDQRNGLHVRDSRYSSNELKEYYPVSSEAGTNTTTIINIVDLTNAAPAVNAQPAAGRVHEVQFIHATCNGAFAANREVDVYISDPAIDLPIYQSGLAALVGTEAGLVFPTDEFTAAATYPGSRNSFDVWNGAYLRFVATGLAVAEEIRFLISWKVKDAGGLRQ